jgi:membrane protein YqaA with SNARE-associated domain
VLGFLTCWKAIDLISILGTLFFAAFVAATLLPAQSEALLAYQIISSGKSASLLVVVATAGNVLGSVVNYAIGAGFGRLKQLDWLRPSEASMQRAEAFYQRYGRWSLLLSWVPVIGDPLTLIAGIMKEKFWRFLFIVSIAKLARYVVVAAFASRYV